MLINKSTWELIFSLHDLLYHSIFHNKRNIITLSFLCLGLKIIKFFVVKIRDNYLICFKPSNYFGKFIVSNRNKVVGTPMGTN